jgi:D-glycero-D-manno-heptose 1,7-bisphosphate phosphatase
MEDLMKKKECIDTIIEEDNISLLIESYKLADQQLQLRIQQRDNFAIQFMISFAALISAMAVDNNILRRICIIAMPLVSFYFCSQIFSSYDVHNRLVYYLKNFLETNLNNTMPQNTCLWESFCEYDRDNIRKSKIGGRKQQFMLINIIIPVIAAVVYFILFGDKGQNIINYITIHNVFSLGYFLIIVLMAFVVNKSHNGSYESKMFDNLAKRGYINKKKRLSLKSKAVFIDRDGTLHVDKVMTRKIEDLEFFPDVIESLKRIQSKGFVIIIVTNQSGIGKGVYTEKEMHIFNEYMIQQLKNQGIQISALYYCPHRTEDNCQCKKPKGGMIRRAAMELNIDLENSFLIGDQNTDILAGLDAGIMNNYLVTTGLYPNSTDKKYKCIESLKGKMKIYDSFSKAIDDILELVDN